MRAAGIVDAERGLRDAERDVADLKSQIRDLADMDDWSAWVDRLSDIAARVERLRP